MTGGQADITMDLGVLAGTLDACDFAETALGFQPDPHQRRVLESSADRVILNCTRQWGKSTVSAAKAIHLAYSKPGSLVLVASPSARQSAEFVRKASTFLRKLGIRPRGDGDNEISLALPNHSRIVGIPGIEHTIRGFSSVSLLLIDEASRVPDELYLALRPMLAVGGGSLWLLSTPNGKRGFFYNEWIHGGSGWTRFTVPATECPRIPARFLQQERAALGPRYFAQEYLCEFHGTSDALFTEDQVRRALADNVDSLFSHTQRTPIRHALRPEYFIGVDLGQRRDHAAIAIIERAEIASDQRNPITFAFDRRTRRALRYLERLPLDTPYTVIAERIERLGNELAAHNPCSVIVDATGVGLPVVDALRVPSARWRLMPVCIGFAQRDTYADGFWRVAKRDLIARLQVAFDFDELTIARELSEGETLIQELTSVRASITTRGRTKYESPGEQHDDLVIALALAWWGADTRHLGQLGGDKPLL